MEQLSAFDIIDEWLIEHGEWHTSKGGYRKRVIYSGKQLDLLPLLVESLHKYGKTKEEMRSRSVVNKVVETCTPKEWYSAKKLRDWKDITAANWNSTVLEFFLNKRKENGTEAVAAQEDLGPQAEPRAPEEYSPDIESNEPQELAEIRKPLDRSIFGDLPPTKLVLDEDFLKEIGGDPNMFGDFNE